MDASIDARLLGFSLSGDMLSNLDEKTIESIAEIVMRTWLGQFPMDNYDSLSFDIEDEDDLWEDTLIY